jgi:hypothetical protein
MPKNLDGRLVQLEQRVTPEGALPSLADILVSLRAEHAKDEQQDEGAVSLADILRQINETDKVIVDGGQHGTDQAQ